MTPVMEAGVENSAWTVQNLVEMATAWLIILIFLSFGISQNVLAQTTNSIPPNLFLTDNGFLFWYKSSGERVVNIKTIKEAEQSKESRPDNQDPEGHWGQTTNGFQVSLRFEKEKYTNGEPVLATMLMRNVTGKPETYFRPIYIVATKDGKVLRRKDDTGLIEITMLPEISLFPQTQHRYQETLNQIYDLTPSGEYTFQAVCNHPKANSQIVNIKISK